MSVIEVDLRLRSPHWSRVRTSDDTTIDGNGLWVQADTGCSDPTDPEVLASHPGRLAAIRINGDEVLLAQDRLRSWPLFWSLENGPDGARRLVISDDATLMREAVSAPNYQDRKSVV